MLPPKLVPVATDFEAVSVYTVGRGDEMRVYLDLVLLLNTAVDFLLLLAANRICGVPGQYGRCLGAAALGGV